MNQYRKPTLDKDLDKFTYVGDAAGTLAKRLVAPGLGLLFIMLSGLVAAFLFSGSSGTIVIAVAAVIGAYMALNIGANDVANNVGPAVGSRAMTMMTALIVAAIAESAGALLAGGDVVSTISKGIIDPAAVADPVVFTAAMMAALISSAVWINLATWVGAPVSTTHAIVGGVMGAGIAAAGVTAVSWGTMGQIAASWVISPLLGGVIAAFFLYHVKVLIIYRDNKIEAAKTWVPVLIAVMTGAFTAYLALKGLKKIIHIDLYSALAIGLAAGIVSYLLSRPYVAYQARGLENKNQSLRKLFKVPLVVSATLLSFAHGANDVANAVGPLAAIVHTAGLGDVAANVAIPLWVMAVGALGISFGLLLFGPKLINMVGQQITKLNPMRAFCVALSAALTVIVASGLGLPVSSTHIAVGAVFGVGFFREWYTANSLRRFNYVMQKNGRAPKEVKPVRNREEMARRKLVRRAHFTTIVAAWVITVPASAILSAMLYVFLSGLI